MRFRTAYEPFREIQTMGRDFTRDFEALARAFPIPRGRPATGAQAAARAAARAHTPTAPTAPAYPPARLWEEETAYGLEVIAPGFEPDKFEVAYDQGTLTVSGERAPAAPEAGAILRTERWSGKFRRTAKLAGPVDADAIAAEYKDGVLRIHIPKAEAAKPKRIQVKTA